MTEAHEYLDSLRAKIQDRANRETLRRQYAGLALQGLLSNSNQNDFRDGGRFHDTRAKMRPSELADQAVRYADALILRLEMTDEEYDKLKYRGYENN